MTGSAHEELIRAEGLSKYYGGFRAVEGIDFSVPRGGVTAFLGPNGAGKSTTMKMLTGFLAPSAGKAWVAGFDIDSQRLEAAARLGYLPENGPLYREMTPAGFLRFAASTRGLRGAACRQALERVAERARLGEVWTKPIRKLSKGFRQRVGLAQALLHDPDVLILDEPTSGLDPNQIDQVRALIRELARDKAVLLSTHILQEVEAVADRVLLVNEGHLRFNGTVVELAADSGLHERFRLLTGGTAA